LSVRWEALRKDQRVLNRLLGWHDCREFGANLLYVPPIHPISKAVTMTRSMTKKKYLTTVAGAALLAIGGAGTAHAVPVYAFANVIVTNFVLQGIADVSGNPLPGVTINGPTLTTSDAATYPGFPAEAFSAPGSLITGSDVLQATAGPSAFPPQNFFNQALLLSAGSRGDAIMSGGSLFQAATSSNVSESNLGTAVVNVVPNTSNASSNAGFSLSVTIG